MSGGRWITASIHSVEDINRIVTAPILAPKLGQRWWIAFLLSSALTLLMLVSVVWLFAVRD
ncbi:MAG TPA: hypothetical protein VHV26_04105 [Rhizomicrobium sp.]|nr:hypothetical protein [Rhizomicrobium sp.]